MQPLTLHADGTARRDPTNLAGCSRRHVRGKAVVFLAANETSSRYRHDASDTESCEAYGPGLRGIKYHSRPKKGTRTLEPVYAQCQLKQKDLNGCLRCVSLKFDQGNSSPIALAKLTSRPSSHVIASTCQSGIRDAICAHFHSEGINRANAVRS